MTIESGTITLSGLHFYAYHGVMSQERTVGAEYSVTLRMNADISQAAVSDNLADTVSYAEVYETVKREMAIPSKLLEHVAYRIGQAVCKSFPVVSSLEVSITKQNPPMGADCEGATVQLHLINDKTHT